MASKPLAPPRNAGHRPWSKVTIHLVRHGQGFHNLGSIPEIDRINMLNPSLTSNGRAQCALLSQRFHAMDKIQYILSSPLRRTVETALLSFKPAIKRGVHIFLDPDLRECGGGRSNTGTNIHHVLEELLGVQEKDYKDYITTSSCRPGWEKPDILRDQSKARAEASRRFLGILDKIITHSEGECTDIVVVTHSRLIELLEEKHQGYFDFCEYKSYKASNIATPEQYERGEDRIILVETEESKNYVHTVPNVVFER